MTRLILILLFCAVLVGVARTAYVDGLAAEDAYLSCTSERVMSFGTGHKTAAIAEMAAIVRWMDETQALGKEYANWALARDRWLSCRRIGKTTYLQCKAAGFPCRPKED